MIPRKMGLMSILCILAFAPVSGDLSVYETFEKELLNEILEVPAEKYSYASFYISLTGKTQNRISVNVAEINEKYVNIYIFNEDNFKLYTEGKTAGPIFSARAEKSFSKVFIPEKSGNYYVVIENYDPFKKTVRVNVVWRYGVSAPDLIPEFIASHPSEVFWGEKVYIDFKVKNFSPVKADEHEIVVYFESEDGELYEIGRVNAKQILAEETKTFSIEQVISKELSRGLYKVKIVADPSNRVEEYNETNNEIYGAKIFVKGAPLTPITQSQTRSTPGFELLIAIVSLTLLALLLRRNN